MSNCFIDAAFEKLIGRKLRLDSYYDLSQVLSKEENKKYYENGLKKERSNYYLLYKNNYPKTFDESQKLIDSFINYDPKNTTSFEAQALFNWYLYPLDKKGRLNYFKEYIKKHFKGTYKYSEQDKIVYNDNIEMNIIGSVSDYIKLISEYEKELENAFFRGQSNVNNLPLPSISRQKNWKIYEDVMFNEMLSNTYESFKDLNLPIEKLIKMQHYGLPTRLLDISSNPLVALYFACNDITRKYGEVIFLVRNGNNLGFINNELITKLSYLTLLTNNEKERILSGNMKDDELKQIYKKYSGMEINISCDELQTDSILIPQKNNQRIIKQDGAFIICGLSNNDEEFIERFNKFRFSSPQKRIICICRNKSEIIKELDKLSINRLSLFPEIDNIATYLKDKYIS